MLQAEVTRSLRVTERVWEQAVTSRVCSARSDQHGAGERRSWWKCELLHRALAMNTERQSGLTEVASVPHTIDVRGSWIQLTLTPTSGNPEQHPEIETTVVLAKRRSAASWACGTLRAAVRQIAETLWEVTLEFTE